MCVVIIVGFIECEVIWIVLLTFQGHVLLIKMLKWFILLLNRFTVLTIV